MHGARRRLLGRAGGAAQEFAAHAGGGRGGEGIDDADREIHADVFCAVRSPLDQAFVPMVVTVAATDAMTAIITGPSAPPLSERERGADGDRHHHARHLRGKVGDAVDGTAMIFDTLLHGSTR